jgi:hypothetical protein
MADFFELHEEFDVTITEMMGSDAPATTGLRLDPSVVDAIKADDPDARFATFIIESGKSRNRRVWKPEIMESIAEQINDSGDVVGYMGHIDPKASGHAFPPVQLHWLKARLNVMSDRTQLLAKAYVLPREAGSVARDYIKRGFVKTVSVAGLAACKPTREGDEITAFQLESIDLARPRTAGMKTALVGGLTSEMSEGGNVVKPEEIAALAENELRAHNPALVTTIEANAKKPLEDKVSEQETLITTSQPAVDLIGNIRKELKLDENGDVLQALSELVAKSKAAGKEARAKFLDSVLERKFRDEGTRTLVKRLVTTEMATGSLVTEMAAVEEMSDEDAQKKTDEIVNHFIDNDADLKRMVSEMQGGTGATFQQNETSRTGTGEIKVGVENDLISVRKAGDYA